MKGIVVSLCSNLKFAIPVGLVSLAKGYQLSGTIDVICDRQRGGLEE
jgi:hypothetical protein